MRLHDRVAIVTGGGGGMGGGIAMCLVREGARIVVSDVNLEGARACVREIEGAGGRALAVQSDVTSEADCKSLVDASIGEFGQIDIVVNNAGHFGERVGVANQTAAEWDDNWGVNVKGPFYLTRAVTTHMAERKFGKIVNISSVNGRFGGSALSGPAYATSKGGLITLTRFLALEHAKDNIQVNCVAPGPHDTPMWRALDGGRRAAILATVPSAQAPGDPDRLAGLIQFLCGPDATYITGATIDINGGQWMG